MVKDEANTRLEVFKNGTSVYVNNGVSGTVVSDGVVFGND